eukprot:Plantae.Rhodophyta-Hildenbrandia_rubra.ctg8234.p1 GENE.Plantae.Rhodophyta-Hildenbrandia_rubra.ctg8234~~Plantae.Rhodophyta-Hildenbrandia_rubra.ctg8234.p1  ORF type:complete len:772 (-),score=140.71 Plantae.Rhodophyta-Hildenbrandia_rubra.ctg8234:1864-4179(-)
MITFVITAPFIHLPKRPHSTASKYIPRCTASSKTPKPPLILGLNQYSHDASAAIVNATNGEILFAGSKERISRRKHDGGAVGDLVRHALEYIGGEDGPEEALKRVKKVVANGHHFSIREYEKRLGFLKAVGYVDDDVVDKWNLVGGADKIELSHHLAHAYSAVGTGGESEGIVVVMDGMGQALREWERLGVINGKDKLYKCDYDFEKAKGYDEWPKIMIPGNGYREAESAYYYRRSDTGKIELKRVFKRWTLERSPPELYNHGFENMESIGAVYSRIALHIFGDWNACGKVMGLSKVIAKKEIPDGSKTFDIPKLMTGSILDGSFRIAWNVIDQLPYANQWHNSNCHNFYRQLATQVQCDLERVALDFVIGLRKKCGIANLVFCGGVALNSALNGRIVREAGYNNCYIPSHPGDEGIAIGCAVFGYQSTVDDDFGKRRIKSAISFNPYLGRSYSKKDVTEAVEEFSGLTVAHEGRVTDAVAKELANGKIIAWFNGRAEFGPRALGNRSLLADPRRRDMVEKLNTAVKKRERFRPFAPSVLRECVSDHFDDLNNHFSPYMSLTSRALYPDQIPAVVHFDGTSRFQSVSKEDNLDYYHLIKAFANITNIPMILNTSFNVAGDPIVESPYDALCTFVECPDIDLLAFRDVVVKRSNIPLTWEDGMDLRLMLNPSIIRSEMIQNMKGDILRISLNGNGKGESMELQDEFELELLHFISEQNEVSLSSAIEEFTACSDVTANEHRTDEAAIVNAVRELQRQRIIYATPLRSTLHQA